ncbi:hypothetical protein GGF31_007857 [Allomyces arbusculus]|nr:hypothetical protein GGF31_007857 [Allomyces arbusculus]
MSDQPAATPAAAAAAAGVPLSQRPLSQRLLATAKHPQFWWFSGHLLTVLGLPHHLLGGSPSAYLRALLGAQLAYGVVLYRQHHGTFKTRGAKAALAQMVSDLNAHYFGLALFFYLAAYPCWPLLVPYFCFSLFHCIGYTRDVLVRTVFPSTVPTPVNRILALLATFTTTYQPRALQLATYWEVTVVPIYLVGQVLLWRQAIAAPVVYAQFLLLRYVHSHTTRAACAHVRTVTDRNVLERPSVPAQVKAAYVKARDTIVRVATQRMQGAGAGARGGR